MVVEVVEVKRRGLTSGTPNEKVMSLQTVRLTINPMVILVCARHDRGRNKPLCETKVGSINSKARKVDRRKQQELKAYFGLCIIMSE